MAERKIDPKFNIHKEYKRMFIMNPYRNGSSELLLDEHGGAKAAYSLNRLRTSYTGSAIRVRRIGDDSEADIGFDNNLLDITTLMSFAGSNAVHVTIWYDQSGNGNNLTQNVINEQPRIVNSGTLNTDGGMPCIEFNGAWMLDSTYNISNTFSLFTVFRITETPPNRFRYNGISEGGANYRIYYGVGDGGIYRVGYGRNAPHTTKTVGGRDLISMVTNGSDIKFYANSVLHLNELNTLPGTPVGNFSLGGVNNEVNTLILKEKVQELIVYEFNQDANRVAIETNINSRNTIY